MIKQITNRCLWSTFLCCWFVIRAKKVVILCCYLRIEHSSFAHHHERVEIGISSSIKCPGEFEFGRCVDFPTRGAFRDAKGI